MSRRVSLRLLFLAATSAWVVAACELPAPVCDVVPDTLTLPEVLCPPPPDDEVPLEPGWLMARPFPEIESLHAVAVLGGTNVYTVGTNGEILHLEGGQWVRQTSGVTANLRGLDGFTDETDGDFLVAVGDEGTVLMKDGDADWVVVASPVTDILFDVWVRNRTDAFIVGDNGTFLRLTDGAVVAMTAESEQTRLVRGNACDLTDTMTPNNGCPMGTACQNLDPADVNSDTVCWNPGRADGLIVETYFLPDPLKGVAGTGQDNVFAIGPRGLVMRFDGTQWLREDSSTARALSSVFTDAGTWATAQDGVLLRRRGDNDWDTQSYRLPVPLYLQDVWATGGNDVFAVGLAGTVYHYTEGLWEETALDDDVHLRAVDGIVTGEDDRGVIRSVFVVGAGGRIVRGPQALPDDLEPAAAP